jgi:8-oxo-dGTP pyrophosphatase MutT (NUDIX family)
VILHADAVAVLRSWVPPSVRQGELRERYLAHLEAHPDGLLRSCEPDHVTASTLVFSADGERVLLTLHAKSQSWFQFGGHTEPQDTTLAGAALREALEESGLTATELDLDPRPVLLDEHAVPFCGSGDVHHLDVMFRAVARDGAQHRISEESLDVAWWPVAELPSDELTGFVALAQSAQSSDGGGSTRAAADQPSR